MSQNGLTDHAYNLLTSLSSYRDNDGTVGPSTTAGDRRVLTGVERTANNLRLSQLRRTRLRGCKEFLAYL